MRNQIEPAAPIDHCPYCGSDSGYFTKDHAEGRIDYNHNFDGTEADNTCMYDMLTVTYGKRAYCIECGRFLFSMKEGCS
jgi:hypothetical protein